ncbi:hypothetical protein [Acholeplasma equifetale]|uniref:hypothetical protein n=1 Tax=Acholeplasma equifetale TaxID=264634 RepID=UPI00047925D9|nr:hypothetical protein [Acholeplasma equifetale]
MEIDYKNKKVKTLCSDIRQARAKLGHREATELFSLINLIESAKNLNFAKLINIHPGIVVGRMQYDKHIPYSSFNNLKETYRIEI